MRSLSSALLLPTFAVALLAACSDSESNTWHGTPSKDAGPDVTADAPADSLSDSLLLDSPVDSPVGPDASEDASSGCVPLTCSTAGAECGSLPDGCGGKLDCGASCPQGQSCGGNGANHCGAGSCTPKSCAQVGASCGYVSDGCSEALYCGGCTGPATCNGGGVANQCGCTPTTCLKAGASCGSVPNGCGGKLECGGCLEGQTCGGGGPNQCGGGTCSPKSCTQLGAACGWASDLCANAIDCGGCTGTDSCGGGGVANQCGCTPKTCNQLGLTCGKGQDGCGGEVDCGECEDAGPVDVEPCNGVDDDGDGLVDEGCSCTDGTKQQCYGGKKANAGVGVCSWAQQSCAGGKWGACDGWGQPGSEVCDGLDNDCNGSTDEGLSRGCSTACGSGTETCQAGNWVNCSAQQPSSEVCGDQIDNNCNGSTDEGCITCAAQQVVWDIPVGTTGGGACIQNNGGKCTQTLECSSETSCGKLPGCGPSHCGTLTCNNGAETIPNYCSVIAKCTAGGIVSTGFTW